MKAVVGSPTQRAVESLVEQVAPLRSRLTISEPVTVELTRIFREMESQSISAENPNVTCTTTSPLSAADHKRKSCPGEKDVRTGRGFTNRAVGTRAL